MSPRTGAGLMPPDRPSGARVAIHLFLFAFFFVFSGAFEFSLAQCYFRRRRAPSRYLGRRRNKKQKTTQTKQTTPLLMLLNGHQLSRIKHRAKKRTRQFRLALVCSCVLFVNRAARTQRPLINKKEPERSEQSAPIVGGRRCAGSRRPPGARE